VRATKEAMRVGAWSWASHAAVAFLDPALREYSSVIKKVKAFKVEIRK